MYLQLYIIFFSVKNDLSYEEADSMVSEKCASFGGGKDIFFRPRPEGGPKQARF